MVKQRQKSKSDINFKKLSKYSDSDEEENELFVIKKASPRKERATVEKVVEEGDTLQSLAIRYCCTIEDLKRLNSIHKENEIFAKRTIRVPHHPISMALAGVHVSGQSSPNRPSTSSQVDTDKLTNSLKETEVNQIIFNSNISQKSVSIENESESDEEDVRLLPQSPAPEAPTIRFDCSGADGDISLKALLIIVVILIFILPLLYVFHLAEEHHVS